MRTDPEPMNATVHRHTECAVVETDANAVEAAPANDLEMQRWMCWVGLELSEASVREGLNVSG